MDRCPLTNIPCSNSKCYEVNTAHNGVYAQINVCDKCAFSALKKTSEYNIDVLMSIIEDITLKHTESKKCQQCNASFDDLIEKSRLGCDKCYDTFKDTILNLLLRCQISLKHIGKKPKNFKLSDASEIENLNIELQEAIKIEDYEKAACLKEKINFIKNKI